MFQNDKEIEMRQISYYIRHTVLTNEIRINTRFPDARIIGVGWFNAKAKLKFLNMIEIVKEAF